MLRRFNLFLIGCLFAFAAYAYARMPDTVPIHFDLGMKPDGWGPRGSILILALIGAATSILLIVVSRSALRNPGLINIPGKAQFLELPRDEQLWVMEPIILTLELIGTAQLGLFLLIELSVYQAALYGTVLPYARPLLLACCAAMFVLPLWLLVATQRRLAAAQKRVSSHLR